MAKNMEARDVALWIASAGEVPDGATVNDDVVDALGELVVLATAEVRKPDRMFYASEVLRRMRKTDGRINLWARDDMIDGVRYVSIVRAVEADGDLRDEAVLGRVTVPNGGAGA